MSPSICYLRSISKFHGQRRWSESHIAYICIHISAYMCMVWVYQVLILGCTVHVLVLYHAERVLQKERKEFLSEVKAIAIAQDAKDELIISETVQSDILNGKSKKDQNHALFEHVCEQATLEQARKLCTIMIRSQGNSRMNDFGKKLLHKLEKVCLNWLSCCACTVYICDACNTLQPCMQAMKGKVLLTTNFVCTKIFSMVSAIIYITYLQGKIYW